MINDYSYQFNGNKFNKPDYSIFEMGNICWQYYKNVNIPVQIFGMTESSKGFESLYTLVYNPISKAVDTILHEVSDEIDYPIIKSLLLKGYVYIDKRTDKIVNEDFVITYTNDNVLLSNGVIKEQWINGEYYLDDNLVSENSECPIRLYTEPIPHFWPILPSLLIINQKIIDDTGKSTLVLTGQSNDGIPYNDEICQTFIMENTTNVKSVTKLPFNRDLKWVSQYNAENQALRIAVEWVQTFFEILSSADTKYKSGDAISGLLINQNVHIFRILSRLYRTCEKKLPKDLEYKTKLLVNLTLFSGLGVPYENIVEMTQKEI